MKIKVRLINHQGAESKLPTRATEGSAGWDLYAAIPSPITIHPRDLVSVPTGVAVGFPGAGYTGFLFARSGLATKHGVTLSNGVGVIDSDYTGELIVGLCNQSNDSYTIQPGERFAQLVIMTTVNSELDADGDIEKTARSDSGFGSSGRF